MSDCKKVIFKTRKDAKKGIKKSNATKGFTIKSYYRCLYCGYFHLTSHKRSVESKIYARKQRNKDS